MNVDSLNKLTLKPEFPHFKLMITLIVFASMLFFVADYCIQDLKKNAKMNEGQINDNLSQNVPNSSVGNKKRRFPKKNPKTTKIENKSNENIDEFNEKNSENPQETAGKDNKKTDKSEPSILKEHREHQEKNFQHINTSANPSSNLEKPEFKNESTSELHSGLGNIKSNLHNPRDIKNDQRRGTALSTSNQEGTSNALNQGQSSECVEDDIRETATSTYDQDNTLNSHVNVSKQAEIPDLIVLNNEKNEGLAVLPQVLKSLWEYVEKKSLTPNQTALFLYYLIVEVSSIVSKCDGFSSILIYILRMNFFISLCLPILSIENEDFNSVSFIELTLFFLKFNIDTMMPIDESKKAIQVFDAYSLGEKISEKNYTNEFYACEFNYFKELVLSEKMIFQLSINCVSSHSNMLMFKEFNIKIESNDLNLGFNASDNTDNETLIEKICEMISEPLKNLEQKVQNLKESGDDSINLNVIEKDLMQEKYIKCHDYLESKFQNFWGNDKALKHEKLEYENLNKSLLGKRFIVFHESLMKIKDLTLPENPEEDEVIIIKKRLINDILNLQKSIVSYGKMEYMICRMKYREKIFLKR